MSLQQLLILGFAAMVGLAVARLVLGLLGRTPQPEGALRVLVIVAFVFVPPIVFGALVDPAAGTIRALGTVPLYAVVLGGFVTLMWSAAQLVRLFVRGRTRPLLLLALAGTEGDPDDVPFDPPVTAKLAGSVALVDRANAMFPRGADFPTQIDRAQFRPDWDALDAATRTLETGIADDHRLGLAVASSAAATAKDARSRLDTLQRLAAEQQSGAATA